MQARGVYWLIIQRTQNFGTYIYRLQERRASDQIAIGDGILYERGTVLKLNAILDIFDALFAVLREGWDMKGKEDNP